MTGVEILTSAEVATEFTSNWCLAGIAWLAIAVTGMIIGLCTTNYNKGVNAVGGLLLGTLVGIFFFAAIATTTETPTAYETQYKVTISDEVSMNDFYEHYEVIDQDGKIFTVRERK